MENYEQKYKEALEWARKVMQGKVGFVLDEVLEKFPELKESEGEMVREEIIDYLKKFIPHHDDDLVAKSKLWIAWLEKKGEQNTANFDAAEKEKNDFVSGQFIECRKSFNEFKELESYWLEYVGDDTYIGRSDNILNQRFHITPQQLFTLFTHQHCPKEEKQSEQKSAWSKEDEKFVHGLIRGLVAKRDIYGHTTFSSDCIDITETINWLKALKDRVSQPHLKPSKEQLEALWNVIPNIPNSEKDIDTITELSELYEELKKL